MLVLFLFSTEKNCVSVQDCDDSEFDLLNLFCFDSCINKETNTENKDYENEWTCEVIKNSCGDVIDIKCEMKEALANCLKSCQADMEVEVKSNSLLHFIQAALETLNPNPIDQVFNDNSYDPNASNDASNDYLGGQLQIVGEALIEKEQCEQECINKFGN